MGYEVTLGPAAIRAIATCADPKYLAEALMTELVDGPNRDVEIRFDRNIQLSQDPAPGTVIYTATPLSVGSYTAVHRPLTSDELQRLAIEQERPVADRGFYVVDVLPPESAFSRRLRSSP
jgi:hypothetical protein